MWLARGKCVWIDAMNAFLHFESHDKATKILAKLLEALMFNQMDFIGLKTSI